MSDEKRKHLRLLISGLNKERKKQAKQIDILCNDFISAQQDFIKALKSVSFAADFYESIAGLTDLNEVLTVSGKLIQEQIQGASIGFFLLRDDSFEMHIFESGQPIDLLVSGAAEGEERRIENFFTAELVGNIARSNHICTIDDMLAMGLQCSPAFLEKISAAAVPLSNSHGTPGFILIYRGSRRPVASEEIQCVAQVARGLGRAIVACRALISSVESA